MMSLQKNLFAPVRNSERIYQIASADLPTLSTELAGLWMRTQTFIVLVSTTTGFWVAF